MNGKVAQGADASLLATRTLPPAPYPWRPAPLIWASLWWHAACAALWAWQPMHWPWWLAMVLLNHVLISMLVLLPRNHLMGRNLTRLSAACIASMPGAVALTIDDGPDPEVTPKVLDMLDAWGAKASFFCIGAQVAKHPEIVRQIIARGHSVENHGFAHSSWFALWNPARMQRDMLQAQQAVHAAAGIWPRYFRPTAGFRNPGLDVALARTGLQLAMWTRRGFDTRATHPGQVLQRLSQSLAAGDILLLHDGNAARTADGTPVILAVLPDLLQQMQKRGLQAVHL